MDIQIQHLLKLNRILAAVRSSSSIIQIQLLLKLNAATKLFAKLFTKFKYNSC